MDILTTHNWTEDQRRYLDQSPILRSVVGILREIPTRQLDTEGQALVRRILRALNPGTVELHPPAAAPIAQVSVFGLIRRALTLTLLAVVESSATGQEGPVLTDEASTALAILETHDPLMGLLLEGPALVEALLGGLTWRRSV